MSHIVFFLKGYIDNCLWNFFAYAIKELGLTDDNFKLWREIHKVSLGFGLRIFSAL